MDSGERRKDTADAARNTVPSTERICIIQAGYRRPIHAPVRHTAAKGKKRHCNLPALEEDYRMADQTIKIELNAVIVAVAGNEPQILITPNNALPSGPFATEHRTLEQGLRSWAGLPLGYVEQLYTFADKDRHANGQRIMSIGYLALLRAATPPTGDLWSPWYRYFPWEDHRLAAPPIIGQLILPALQDWVAATPNESLRQTRAARVGIAFPRDMRQWNDELVLPRYELLWEAGLVEESPTSTPPTPRAAKAGPLGSVMAHDHRRIVATAMARLRAKIKYRPVVFEVMPDSFTLLQLQSTVEALAGLRLHKQNFRRLVESQGLVEETGAMTRGASGRPAKLFAFRPQVLRERAAAGTKLPRSS